jgi:hypothetical protein
MRWPALTVFGLDSFASGPPNAETGARKGPGAAVHGPKTAQPGTKSRSPRSTPIATEKCSFGGSHSVQRRDWGAPKIPTPTEVTEQFLRQHAGYLTSGTVRNDSTYLREGLNSPKSDWAVSQCKPKAAPLRRRGTQYLVPARWGGYKKDETDSHLGRRNQAGDQVPESSAVSPQVVKSSSNNGLSPLRGRDGFQNLSLPTISGTACCAPAKEGFFAPFFRPNRNGVQTRRKPGQKHN